MLFAQSQSEKRASLGEWRVSRSAELGKFIGPPLAALSPLRLRITLT